MSESLRRFLVNYLPAVILLLGFCYMGYISAPQGDGFEWSSINPMVFVGGLMFALSYGLGLSVWLSAIVVVLFIVLLYSALRWLIGRFV